MIIMLKCREYIKKYVNKLLMINEKNNLEIRIDKANISKKGLEGDGSQNWFKCSAYFKLNKSWLHTFVFTFFEELFC